MKIGQTLIMILTASLIIGLAASCKSTGNYMPLTGNETVLGPVQTTFVVRSALFSMKDAKDAVNTEAYIKLLEAAGKKFPGNIDIRDIIWVTGRAVDNQNTEISTAGKVIRVE